MSGTAAHRRGFPSPLLFHLGAAATAYQGAIAAMAGAHDPDFPWHPDLSDAAAELPPDLDPLAASAAALARLRGFLSGLEKWQTHPYRRTLVDPPEIWRQGASRLLDYGQTAGASDPQGPAVLVVPSLINRAYILDLEAENSLLRYLASRGLRPLLLDWGVPNDSETSFDLADYARHRLLPALEIAAKSGAGAPAVLGYCMGGTLAAGTLARTGFGISAFATIGSPWDFAGYSGIAASLRGMALGGQATPERTLDILAQSFGLIPGDLFQSLFAAINPLQAAVKFRNFDRMDMDSDKARCFVALEDWLADCAPMAAPAAKNLLIDWNLHNTPATGGWEHLGGTVDLASLRAPSLAICGARDTIAPPDVSRPLSDALPDCRVLLPDAGHVGMIAGSRAREDVWAPLAEFFGAHSG